MSGPSQAEGKGHNELYASDFESMPASPCLNVCEPQGSCSLFYAGAEYRYLRTHFSEGLAYATTTDTLTPTGLDRRVNAQELDFDYRSSFRVLAGYHLSDHADIQFSYWYLDTETRPSGEVGAGQIITDPFGNVGTAGDTIDTSASVRLNVYDLEYIRPLAYDCAGTGFQYSAGVRFADVDQFYDAIIRDATGPVQSSGVFTADFFGVGPYLSTTGRVAVGQRQQFSLFAKGAVALLVGQYDIAGEVSLPGIGVVAGQEADRVRMVPVMESELGAMWEPAESLRFSAGWLFQSWWNIGASGGTFNGAFTAADDSDIMSFDGLFVRAELWF